MAIGQINQTVGDLAGNAARIRDVLDRAEAAGADLAVLPELAVTGYPPEDLVLRPGFVAAGRDAIAEIAASTGRCAALVGFADGAGQSRRAEADMAGAGSFSSVYNAVAVCAGGRLHGVYRKRHLPNYDVFDEMRTFRPGAGEPPGLFEIAGALVGVTLCEDAWVPDGPLAEVAAAGAQLVANLSSSPFREGKQAAREELMGRRAAAAGVPVVYANLVGGQDDLVFDGGSFAVTEHGEVSARCASFEEAVEVFDVGLAPPRPPTRAAAVTAPRAGSSSRPRIAGPLEAPLDGNAERWAALVLATRDYVRKSGFRDVAVGLSGGVDSSLVAAVAADALGAERVHGVLMPSRYSSEHSLADAEKLAANLGIGTCTLGIDPAHSALAAMLQPVLDPAPAPSARRVPGPEPDPSPAVDPAPAPEPAVRGGLAAGGLTDQNLQSRIRGVLLMALANEHGWLVLTTGNKSELAVGYSTLYGDTAGAYAVICDVWKLSVYELCRWRNRRAGRELVPAEVLSKAPSAELAPGQRDDQWMPPYEVLDPILRLYVEELRTVAEIQSLGLASADEVARVCALVGAAEYKRRQSPLGPRLTGRAFGRDRRMPIVNRYR